MIDNISKFLPEEINDFYNFSISLKTSKDDWKYYFMPEEEYMSIKDPKKQICIYWTEILYRCHIVSLVSIFKITRWLESMDNNVNNYYGFCSNLRSLIESCADSFFTLRSVPLTIANDYKLIKEILNCNSPILTIHEKLESTLLHFIDGTKLNKEQKKEFPKYFNAEHITDYLKTFEDGNDEIIKLYRFLCGISHPASESTKMFLFLHKGDTYVCGDSYNLESNLVEDLLDQNKESLLKMIRTISGNINCILKLLNEFPIPLIHTDYRGDNLKEYIPWIEVKDIMHKSIEKYKIGIKTKSYK